MNQIDTYANKLEGLPGYGLAIDWINDKLGDHFETKDPFYVEINGKRKKRKVPETCTKETQKAWKKIKKRAWLDDRNFFGCYPIDLGFGLAPLLSLLPVIGQILMWATHMRLITIATQQMHIPNSLQAKMHANIVFDILISLPPIIGSLFTWLNACSTRNAALVHTYIVKEELKRQTQFEKIENQFANEQFGYHQPQQERFNDRINYKERLAKPEQSYQRSGDSSSRSKHADSLV
ncbi:hypothetical protein WICMUC_003937 [Wickerhamomyces mucosus]|uniref:Uncharacterized protein n=1 Tax=Wickerhamomyces mucosus TaxID=1378264 RepID=A0A9P8TBV5_9ASCO|nr:hypothetical protein WICMUC_003937 [Wickerhamomyces mucosus]